MTEEHKQKIREGRERAKRERESAKNSKPSASIESKVEDLSKKFDQLVEIVGHFVEEKGEKTSSTISVNAPASQAVTMSASSVKFDPLASLIPPKWREIINEKLGNDFDADIQDSNGNFLLRIYMPSNLDRRVGDRDGRDHSSGLVRRASAEADVRIWCDRILSNIQKIYPNFKK